MNSGLHSAVAGYCDTGRENTSDWCKREVQDKSALWKRGGQALTGHIATFLLRWKACHTPALTTGCHCSSSTLQDANAFLTYMWKMRCRQHCKTKSLVSWLCLSFCSIGISDGCSRSFTWFTTAEASFACACEHLSGCTSLQTQQGQRAH